MDPLILAEGHDSTTLAWPLFLVVGGLCAVVWGIVRITQARGLQRRAVPTQGQVVESRLQTSKRTDSQGNLTNETQSHFVETVRFVVDEGTVTGSPKFPDRSNSEDRAGQAVPVYYDPNAPGTFIAPRNGTTPELRNEKLTLVVGIVLLVIAVVFAFAL
jgi:uncharacterized integral membrane protein